MLTVSTIDLDTGLDPVDSTAIMTDARIVYASQSNLYVDDRVVGRPARSRARRTSIQSGVSTTINVFDISSPTKTVYLGSGSVPGFLLDSYSMSEFQGVLRVVSTQTPAWWGPGANSQSFLTTLKMQNGSLGQVGQVERARPGRARVRGALRRRHGLRRHLPAGRPAVHASTSPTRRSRRCSAS